ncbi:MAG: electron transfer flavoprotein subunit alpha/FixB family protein [Candidatus Bathyarchaeia archaeon]|nr:electron transfer flavoprotein subunit alpha/FixB family protein [Candidatus Bathyarchaeota archaeon]
MFSNGVLVYSEYDEGAIHPVAFELLGKSREIADRLGVEVWGVIVGYRIGDDKARELIYYGADRVFIYDHPRLEYFDPVLYRDVLVDLVERVNPSVFLFGATPLGRSLAPRVAAAIGAGLTADCIDIQVDENGDIIQVRPAFTGNILAYIKTTSRPVMSTVRYRVMKMPNRDTSRVGEIIRLAYSLGRDSGIRVLGRISRRSVDLGRADIVVAGGRGFRKKEDLKMLEDLANLLGGVVGVSRPLVDEGWMPRERQVGFSGNTVKPRLYMAFGISGSPQHIAGMRGSEVVVAVNIDPSAPIFKIADYGIIGDLYEVIPKLIEELNRIKRG